MAEERHGGGVEGERHLGDTDLGSREPDRERSGEAVPRGGHRDRVLGGAGSGSQQTVRGPMWPMCLSPTSTAVGPTEPSRSNPVYIHG